jgi:hypothetical protein
MKNGPYELVIAPADYPGPRYRDRYCYEHHLVWWKNTGEVPGLGFDVHHKNENKRDNRFKNLEKKTHAGHAGEHSRERGKPPVMLICEWCWTPFFKKQRHHRFLVKAGQTQFFCSRSCQVSKQQKDRHT